MATVPRAMAAPEAPVTSESSPIRRRHRRRPQPPGTRSCPHCGRTFKRTEHLERHVRTHTKEKPFICLCGAAFTRRDLLTRHQRITLHEGESARGDGQSSEHTESPDADGPGSGPVEIPHSNPELRKDPPHPDLAAAISLSGLSTEGWPQAPVQQSPMYNLPVQPPQAVGVVPDVNFDQTALMQSQYMPVDGEDLGIDAQFRDFVHFLDGMGLPAEWSPYFYTGPGVVGDGAVGEDTAEETCPPPKDGSMSPTVQGSSRPDPRSRPRTPFTAWLPSAPTANRVSAALQELAPRSAGNDAQPLRVTEDQRTQLSDSLASFHSILPDPGFKIPPRHAMSRYVISFFEGFHSHMPFIHLPTWRILDHSLELVLGIAALGAQYCFEHRMSERLFYAGKAIALYRLQVRGRTGPWKEDDTTEMVKAIVTLMGFATWEPKVELLREAFALQPLLAQLLRESGLNSDPAHDVSRSPDEQSGEEDEERAWRLWVNQESNRRSKLISFSFLHTHSIAYDVYPILRSNEISLRLPCSTPEWKAPSAIAWRRVRAQVTKEQLFFQEALGQLLRHGSETPQPLDPIPTPLGNYLVLHGLLQRIHILHDLSLPSFSGPASLPSDEVEKLERGLRAWTSGWQQAPESSLDPNNENGPIPFTSAALVGLAYARIHCHLGPYRRLDTRDPDVVAVALARAPAISRGDSIISALLYAAHMLSIPVRLGVDRVARSQAFFWSVRHSLSGLECAVLLCKWLVTVGAHQEAVTNSNPSQPPALTDSEDRILQWVRTIVEEAYAVVDFDDGDDNVDILRGRSAADLGLDVLRIWAHFFKSNTQWKFINIIGESLQRYRVLLLEARRQEAGEERT